jgi:AmmeMemoRadiSam system protein A
MKEKRGVFVTLTKNGELRGCIGFIQPLKSIYDSVKENALNAAFHDPRFKPLQKEELKDLKIEISILTLPVKIGFKEPKELLQKLTPHHGVILEKSGHQATFLPQVWEQITDPIEFLQQLSWKAGLTTEAWKSANISIYTVEKFEEK